MSREEEIREATKGIAHEWNTLGGLPDASIDDLVGFVDELLDTLRAQRDKSVNLS